VTLKPSRRKLLTGQIQANEINEQFQVNVHHSSLGCSLVVAAWPAMAVVVVGNRAALAVGTVAVVARIRMPVEPGRLVGSS
jgi:hypothetical protein